MKEFDFDDIGKKTPYRIPEGFFDEMQHKVMECTSGEKRCGRRLRLIISGVIVAAAMMAGILFVPFMYSDEDMVVSPAPQILVAETNHTNVEPVDKWINELSDEELEELVNFSENDIFLN